MQWQELSDALDLPWIIDFFGHRGVMISSAGITVRSDIYRRLLKISTAMIGADIIPAIDGWHPTDVIGELVTNMGPVTLSWPVFALFSLAIALVKGWVTPHYNFSWSGTVGAGEMVGGFGRTHNS